MQQRNERIRMVLAALIGADNHSAGKWRAAATVWRKKGGGLENYRSSVLQSALEVGHDSQEAMILRRDRRPPSWRGLRTLFQSSSTAQPRGSTRMRLVSSFAKRLAPLCVALAFVSMASSGARAQVFFDFLWRGGSREVVRFPASYQPRQ